MPRELENLRHQHKAIGELYLSGARVCDIATELGLKPNSVSRITQSPLFQDFIARRRREIELDTTREAQERDFSIRERLHDASGRAVNTLTGLLESENEGIQLRSSGVILAEAFKRESPADGDGAASVQISTVNVKVLQLALNEANEPLTLEAEFAEVPPAAVAVEAPAS